MSLYLVVNDFTFFSLLTPQRSEPSIGVLVSVKQDGRYKTSQTLGWKKVQKKLLLYAGDSIFSGNDSKVFIRLKNKSTITLYADSIISFPNVSDEKLTKIQIDYGDMELSVEESSSMQVQNEHGIITVEPKRASAKVRLTAGTDMKLKVMTGEVEVSANGAKQIVSPKTESVAFREAGVPLEPIIISNDNHAEVAPQPLQVAARPVSTTIPLIARAPQNEVSASKKITAAAKPAKTRETSAKVPVPTLKPTPVPLITDEMLVAPKLYEPLNEGSLFFPKNVPLGVLFSWAKVKFADSYVIQFAAEQAFRKVVFETKVAEPSIKYIFKDSMKIFWRVKSVSASGGKSDWSKIHTVNISNEN